MSLVEELRDGIVAVVVDNFDYFRANPSHLAWAMMNFELLQRVGRKNFETCYDNPKYVVINAGERLPGKSDANLLYDAWGVTVSNYDEFPDTNPNIPLESKQNKTLDEWVELLIDSRYRYSGLFPNDQWANYHLLCSSGTGLKWNHEGYIAEVGAGGTDATLFAGYTRTDETMEPLIRQKIIDLRSHPAVKMAAEDYLREAYETAQRIYAGEDDMEVLEPPDSAYRQLQRTIEEIAKNAGGVPPTAHNRALIQGRPPFRLDETSNLVTMPAYAHASYVAAGIQIAGEIVQNGETDRAVGLARTFLQRFEASEQV